MKIHDEDLTHMWELKNVILQYLKPLQREVLKPKNLFKEYYRWAESLSYSNGREQGFTIQVYYADSGEACKSVSFAFDRHGNGIVVYLEKDVPKTHFPIPSNKAYSNKQVFPINEPILTIDYIIEWLSDYKTGKSSKKKR